MSAFVRRTIDRVRLTLAPRRLMTGDCRLMTVDWRLMTVLVPHWPRVVTHGFDPSLRAAAYDATAPVDHLQARD